jgi:glycosyltransferase involved in cell wall biosynthesis
VSVVSFVMPVWNPRRDWFLQAVDSVLGQRGCDIDLIVVDDGCPEPIDRLLTDLGDARLRVVRVDHGGESAARNAGVAAARADHIRFVDADDVLAPASTSRLLQLAGRRDDVIAYGATMFCDPELRPLWKMTCRVKGDARVDCLLGRFTVRHTSLLFPRAVVEATGEWNTGMTVSQDWDFVLRALEHASVTGDREIAGYYRKHGTSATADVDAGVQAARRIVRGYFERHPEQRRTRLQKRAEASLEASLGRIYLTRGERRAALDAARRSLTLDVRALPSELWRSLPALAGVVRGRRRPR